MWFEHVFEFTTTTTPPLEKSALWGAGSQLDVFEIRSETPLLPMLPVLPVLPEQAYPASLEIGSSIVVGSCSGPVQPSKWVLRVEYPCPTLRRLSFAAVCSLVSRE